MPCFIPKTSFYEPGILLSYGNMYGQHTSPTAGDTQRLLIRTHRLFRLDIPLVFHTENPFPPGCKSLPAPPNPLLPPMTSLVGLAGSAFLCTHSRTFLPPP